MKMRIIMSLCILLTVVIFSACGQEKKDSIAPHEDQYSLFTWNTHSGDFCFAIMTRPKSSKFIHSWTAKLNAKCGASELKKALTTLPKDSQVFWETWPPRKFDYPADSVVKEILEFAKSKGVDLEQSPALQ